MGADLVKLGLVPSLNRPGRNVDRHRKGLGQRLRDAIQQLGVTALSQESEELKRAA